MLSEADVLFIEKSLYEKKEALESQRDFRHYSSVFAFSSYGACVGGQLALLMKREGKS